MDDEVERAAVTQSDGDKVTQVARRQTTDAERLGERYDRTIDEAQAEIGEALIHFHRTGELTERRRRVGEGASSEILHEHLHRAALVAKEIIDFGKHETGNVASACLVNGVAKQAVVWRALDEIIEQRAGVADQRSRATGRH